MKHLCLVFLVLLLYISALAATHRASNLLRPNRNQIISNRAYHILDITYSWFGNSTWNPSSNYIYHYNAQTPANIDSLEAFHWDYELSAWHKNNVLLYGYDLWGRVTSITRYITYDGNYDYNSRAEYFYDNQHRIITVLWYYDDIDRTEYLEARTHFIYSGNRLAQIVEWYYDSWNDEVSYYKEDYSADNQGRVIDCTGYDSPDSLNWTNSWKGTYTYDSHDTSTAADLVEYISSAYAMDDLDLYLLVIPCMWNTTTSQEWNGTAWINTDRTTYTWQIPQNRLQLALVEDWDEGAWVQSYQDTFTYDANGNCTWDLSWEMMDGNWQESGKAQFNWGSFVANDDPVVPAPEALSLKAWPLPFASELKIQPISSKTGAIKISLYNLKGQLIKQDYCLPDDIFTWDGCDSHGAPVASGIYFIRAEQGTRSCTTRIVKMK